MIANDIAREGALMTLRRVTGTGDVHFDVEVYGYDSQYKPEEIVGEIAQGDIRVIISNREILARSWPGPPRRSDVVIIDGKPHRVMGNEIQSIGGEVVMHWLQVRG